MDLKKINMEEFITFIKKKSEGKNKTYQKVLAKSSYQNKNVLRV